MAQKSKTEKTETEAEVSNEQVVAAISPYDLEEIAKKHQNKENSFSKKLD